MQPETLLCCPLCGSAFVEYMIDSNNIADYSGGYLRGFITALASVTSGHLRSEALRLKPAVGPGQ